MNLITTTAQLHRDLADAIRAAAEDRGFSVRASLDTMRQSLDAPMTDSFAHRMALQIMGDEYISRLYVDNNRQDWDTPAYRRHVDAADVRAAVELLAEEV